MAMHVQKSFWDYFWLTKFLLRVSGILPIGGTPALWKSIASDVLVVCPIFSGSYLVIPELNYILFGSHAIEDLLEAIIIVIAVASGQLRSIIGVLYRQKIVQLFSVCRKLWDQALVKDREVIAAWARRAKLFVMVYFFASQCTVIVFVMITIVKQCSSPANSTTKYYPFHYKEDSVPRPQYEIKYTIQVVIGVLGILYVAAIDMAGTLLALNMCGQLAIIRNWLLEVAREELSPTKEKIHHGLEEVLKKSICRHQIVLDFCSELEEVVQYIYLIQIVTGMYIMAIAASGLTGDLRSCRYIGPFFMASGGVFFTCWPADSLSFASTEVTDVVYGLPWYSFSPREKKTAAIILARCQRPASLTAGKFVVLSLQTFVSILYSGISFCMVVNGFK